MIQHDENAEWSFVTCLRLLGDPLSHESVCQQSQGVYVYFKEQSSSWRLRKYIYAHLEMNAIQNRVEECLFYCRSAKNIYGKKHTVGVEEDEVPRGKSTNRILSILLGLTSEGKKNQSSVWKVRILIDYSQKS